jgi:adenylate cyclase class 2
VNYEVELKFSLSGPERICRNADALGAQWSTPIRQCDTYFAHPSRDFAVTDEAFRLRTVGDRHWLTYKGPLVDRETKTRQEVEVPLADGPLTAQQVTAMLAGLGFREVRRVQKTRRSAHVSWQNCDVEISLDEVDGLGSFVEIEIIADEARWEAAKSTAMSLAGHLNLSTTERRSYLQLLIEQDGVA